MGRGNAEAEEERRRERGSGVDGSRAMRLRDGWLRVKEASTSALRTRTFRFKSPLPREREFLT